VIHRLINIFNNRRTKALDNEQGMILLEVLVALVILSLALVTMLGQFSLSGRLSADTYRYNAALTLAQSKMEEIKNTSFNDLTGVATTRFSHERDYAQFQGMTYAVDVVENGLHLKTVTVTVSYDDAGIPKQLQLVTEVARR
jgi:Tfp pilus assembly protein PilV